MKQLTIEQSKELLEAAEESLRMEFKASVDTSSESWLRDELVRAILAMSNTDTGGDIVIGVKESSDNVFLFEGVEQSHLEAFNVDDFKTLIESFSVSPVSFELYEAVLEENRKFVIVRVAEFRRTPTICRKDGKFTNQKGRKVLEEGAVYIRTLKDKPSSVRLVNPLDMQDLFERATDKEISFLHKRGWTHLSEHELNKADKSAEFGKERSNF